VIRALVNAFLYLGVGKWRFVNYVIISDGLVDAKVYVMERIVGQLLNARQSIGHIALLAVALSNPPIVHAHSMPSACHTITRVPLTVDYPITVCVDIGFATAAHSRVDFVRIIRTAVVAVRGSITVTVGVSHATTAHAWLCLARIIRTAVIAVRRTIAVAVSIRHTTTAHAWLCLARIIRAFVLGSLGQAQARLRIADR